MSTRPMSAHARNQRKQPSFHEPNDLETECTAAFLCVYDDTQSRIQTKEELLKVLQQSGRNPTNKNLSKYWPQSKSSMTFHEFLEICRHEKMTTEDDLMKAFKKIDKDGNGLISNKELHDVLTKRGERLSTAEVQEIIDEVDEDGNGQLDFKEFCNYLLKTQSEAKKMAKLKMEKKLRKQKKTSMQKEDTSRQKEVSISKKSDDESDDSDIIVGSKLGKTSPSERSALSEKSSKSPKPRNLSHWQCLQTRGCFFIESDGQLSSHQFELQLPKATNAWITIQPVSVHPGDVVSRLDSQKTPMDTFLVLLRANNSVVAMTENRDKNGVYHLRCDLEKGQYRLLPFSTGTRLKKQSQVEIEEKRLIKKRGESITITEDFRTALKRIFDMCDLDKDGFLSRQEFNWFNLRTSDEEVEDEEWNVVRESIKLDDDRVPLPGFIKLNEMEAEDNEGDTDDLWVTLNSMGFDKSLTLSAAALFQLELYLEDECNAVLQPCGVKAGGKILEKSLVELVTSKGEVKDVKEMKDLRTFTYCTETWGSIVAENKSNNRLQVNLDCSKSNNCVSNRKSLNYGFSLPPQSAAVGHHFTPKDEMKSWSFVCTETVL